MSTNSSDRNWTIDDVVRHLSSPEIKQVMIMAGAGISTPSGIPDFRTSGSGLYDNLKQYNLPYAEAIFELNYFLRNPQPFFMLAKELHRPGHYKPNIVHYFCLLMHKKRKLLRMYTQNIDGLEKMAGIPSDKLVEAHGTFSTARCTSCRKSYDGSIVQPHLANGSVPFCKEPNCKGIIKPDIVFFGELLPDSFYQHITDVEKADTLLVMGTSLEVEPFASVAAMVDDTVPRVLINKEPVKSFVLSDNVKDVLLLGDISQNITTLTAKLGWASDLEDIMRTSRSIDH